MVIPIRLLDKNGELEESYGYDEFGQDLYGNQGMIQPFGYTGYQSDRVAGTYFAQAREYQPQNGRFTAEDVIKGNGAVPETLNQYAYCLNSPMALVDRDGRTADLPSVISGMNGEKINILLSEIRDEVFGEPEYIAAIYLLHRGTLPQKEQIADETRVGLGGCI